MAEAAGRQAELPQGGAYQVKVSADKTVFEEVVVQMGNLTRLTKGIEELFFYHYKFEKKKKKICHIQAHL